MYVLYKDVGTRNKATSTTNSSKAFSCPQVMACQNRKHTEEEKVFQSRYETKLSREIEQARNCGCLFFYCLKGAHLYHINSKRLFPRFTDACIIFRKPSHPNFCTIYIYIYTRIFIVQYHPDQGKFRLRLPSCWDVRLPVSAWTD